MGLLLILDTVLDIFITIMLHGRLVITHLEDIFGEGNVIVVSTINVLMILKNDNLLVAKLKIKNKNSIKRLIIKDIP